MDLKSHLESLLSQAQLGEAIQVALFQLKRDGLQYHYEQAIQHSARWFALQRELTMGQTPFEKRMEYEDDLRGDFISFVGMLPPDLAMLPPAESDQDTAEVPKDPPVKPSGISEDRFKWHVFLGLTVIKGGLLIYLSYLNSVGMPTQDYKTLLGLMLPVFTTAFILMAKHLFDRRGSLSLGHGPRVNRGNQWFTYLVLFAYLCSMLLALRPYGRTSGDLSSLIDWVNATEALLGGALGYVVSTLFKSDKPK